MSYLQYLIEGKQKYSHSKSLSDHMHSKIFGKTKIAAMAGLKRKKKHESEENNLDSLVEKVVMLRNAILESKKEVEHNANNSGEKDTEESEATEEPEHKEVEKQEAPEKEAPKEQPEAKVIVKKISPVDGGEAGGSCGVSSGENPMGGLLQKLLPNLGSLMGGEHNHPFMRISIIKAAPVGVEGPKKILNEKPKHEVTESKLHKTSPFTQRCVGAMTKGNPGSKAGLSKAFAICNANKNKHKPGSLDRNALSRKGFKKDKNLFVRAIKFNKKS